MHQLPRRALVPPAPASSGSKRSSALSVLEDFGDGMPRLTPAEIAEWTGLYPSAVLRLAASLDRFGYLHRGADGLFRFGPTPLRLGLLCRNVFDLADHLRPALSRPVERAGETAAFYVREGDRCVCLYRHHSPRATRRHVEEGRCCRWTAARAGAC